MYSNIQWTFVCGRSAILGVNFPEDGFSVLKFDLKLVSTTYSELRHT